MNFLAHCVLSPQEPYFLVGNLIVDLLDKKQRRSIPERFPEPWKLHLCIDEFTDGHPLFKKSCQKFWPDFHHLSPVFVDIFYDHFLAKNFEQFVQVSLSQFSHDMGVIFRDYPTESVPLREGYSWENLAPSFVEYQNFAGVKRALNTINGRSRRKFSVPLALEKFLAYSPEVEKGFCQFFQEIVAATEKYREGKVSVLKG